MGIQGEGFGSFGISLDLTDDNLIIAPNSPESMLRLSAIMSRKEPMILDPVGTPSGSFGALYVELSEPAYDDFEFQAVVHSRNMPISNWLSIPPLHSHPVIESEVTISLLEDLGKDGPTRKRV